MRSRIDSDSSIRYERIENSECEITDPDDSIRSTTSHYNEIVNYAFDIVTAIISLLDLITDIMVTIQYYSEAKYAFFHRLFVNSASCSNIILHYISTKIQISARLTTINTPTNNIHIMSDLTISCAIIHILFCSR